MCASRICFRHLIPVIKIFNDKVMKRWIIKPLRKILKFPDRIPEQFIRTFNKRLRSPFLVSVRAG